MNKEDIFKKLEQLNFDRNEYIIISGASMVVQSIRTSANDIDIAISEKLEQELLAKNYKYHKSIDNCNVYELDGIELFRWQYEETDYIFIDGYRFANLESILKLKRLMNRKKDQKDINLLELVLCKEDNRFLEKELYKQGYSLICGTDEVGRGPLIGPVVAAAVILPKDFFLEGLTDSKKLTEKKREEFDKIIKEKCLSYGIGVIDNNIIDEVNIYEASKMAMIEAIRKLDIKPDYVITDAMKLNIDYPIKDYIKGDLKSITISAASVIAKVYRDSLLIEMDKKHPEYNFKKNKGYPTKQHIEAINTYGILEEHRKSYGPVQEYILNHKSKSN